MKVGILTSSRADFGIYLPLLKRLAANPEFEMKIIAFGTHLSGFYGNTAQEIINNGFDIDYKVESMLLTDSSNAVATSIGLTILKFADFWQNNSEDFDIVFCLGDRYEMLAAVIAGVPFQIKFAHLHGGEITLGAIDNVFRHTITLASAYHFVSTEVYAKRVADIIGSSKNIYNVGALSLDNLGSVELFTFDGFKTKWNVDLSFPTVLVTFHPETVAFEMNGIYTDELVAALKQLDEYQILITMPNADTNGNLIRQKMIDNFGKQDNVHLVENLGTKGYFTAMKYCSFLLGNTSSGIIEAASFSKYVINIGNRQLGRECGVNVIHCKIDKNEIADAIKKVERLPKLDGKNIYGKGDASEKVYDILRKLIKAG